MDKTKLMLFSSKHNIFHIASMARSGETLMLKLLAVHDQVAIVHNVQKEDDVLKEKAFRFLMQYPKTRISSLKRVIKHYKLRKGAILILKQGVWKHQHPFNGFVLSRNPISIYSSLKSYDKHLPEYDSENNFWFNNNERLLRWSKDMSFNLYEDIKDAEPLEQFVKFYNYRMGDLANQNIPIIRFENLILNPEETIKRVCEILELDFTSNLIESHKFYDKGLIGHGQNDLSQPINSNVLTKYKLNVTEKEFNYIAQETKAVSQNYGYTFTNNEVLY